MTDAISLSVNDKEEREEGWLYLVRSNRFGLQSFTKRYFVFYRCKAVEDSINDDIHFVRKDGYLGLHRKTDGHAASSCDLQQHVLECYNCFPSSNREVPLRSAVVDCCIRVTDNGRESINRKVLFTFTLCSTFNPDDCLKLGSSCPEAAARWIRAFQQAALKGVQNYVRSSKGSLQSFSRFTRTRRSSRIRSIDWGLCASIRTNAVPDVIAPSTWTIFGCQNGLRLFKEAKDRDSRGMWDDHSAIMAVSVVDGSSEAIFQALMSLGSSRSEWDFCFHKGSVIEHHDGHTDIIHEQLYKDWLPWSMTHRDFLLQRYWRREDDGTYVILYHSVLHKKCPPQKGFIRACVKSGGYVVTPVNQGKRSLVKHMLAIDWKSWKLYIRASATRSVTIRMLGRLAALREFFRAKLWDFPSPVFSSLDLEALTLNVHDRPDLCEESEKAPSERASLAGLNDAADEFFDVQEPSEDGWNYTIEPTTCPQDMRPSRLSTAAVLRKKLHDLAANKKGYTDLQELAEEEEVSCSYGASLPGDSSFLMLSSWAMADPSSFLIRGQNYLVDQTKIKANGTLMEMIGADWLKSDKREDNLAGRPGSIVQKCAARGGSEFFFIVNIQVPGTTTYCLALYFMTKTPLKDVPLLDNFVKGDDAYRNSRFKLIPYISKGSWIVKQSVGKKACLIGQALVINYFHGDNYIELGVDIGSSTVARGVVSLVLGYLSNLVIEMAFLVQGNNEEELPEYLLGTCRLNHLDTSKAVSLKAF